MDIRILDNVFGVNEDQRRETLIQVMYNSLCITRGIDFHPDLFKLYRNKEDAGYSYLANGPLDVKKDAHLTLLLGEDFAQQLEFINDHDGCVERSMLNQSGVTLATIITSVPDEHLLEYMTVKLTPDAACTDFPLHITFVLSYLDKA